MFKMHSEIMRKHFIENIGAPGFSIMWSTWFALISSAANTAQTFHMRFQTDLEHWLRVLMPTSTVLTPTLLVLRNVAISGQKDTRGEPRGKIRGGGQEEKELQLSSQTRTICLICVTCFLLIWEVCWRDLGVWERPGRAGPWAKASLLLGSLSEWH